MVLGAGPVGTAVRTDDDIITYPRKHTLHKYFCIPNILLFFMLQVSKCKSRKW